MPAQLGLFEERDDEPAQRAWARTLAARLPEDLRLGTCSWSFPGWDDIVYARGSRPRRVSQLAREGLRDYARHPLLRTVEIDRGFYAPLPEADLRRYAEQLPAGYRCVLKAPAAVTSLALPGAPRHAAVANPDYLSHARLDADLIGPCTRAFAGHTGPIVFQFTRAPRELRLAPDAFAAQLDGFLSGLPRALAYAVELRDPGHLSPAYADVLRRHGVAHAYTYWSDMPPLLDQERRVPGDTAPFVLARLMLKPGRRYENERRRFAPFDHLVEPDDAMRSAVRGLVARALARGQPAWVLANNKAEGCAPLTLFALAELLARDSAP